MLEQLNYHIPGRLLLLYLFSGLDYGLDCVIRLWDWTVGLDSVCSMVNHNNRLMST